MTRYSRAPQIMAWLVTLALIAVITFGAVQGLRALEPAAPAGLEHVHGVIMAIRGGNEFAMRLPHHADVVWFDIARGSHLSLAHLRRHMAEQASTDVYYQSQQHGLPLVWLAD